MQSEEPREKPASVLIQAGVDNKLTASQPASTLTGQPQGMTNNQYVIQETMKNGVATSGNHNKVRVSNMIGANAQISVNRSF